MDETPPPGPSPERPSGPSPRSPGPSGGRGRVVGVLLAAGAAPWEAEAVARLTDAAQGVHLLQRCLDLGDLLAAAATGTAEIAVVAAGVGGFDADSTARLHRAGVRVVAVADPAAREARGRLDAGALRRLGVDLVVGPDELPQLAARVREVAAEAGTQDAPGWLRGPADGVDLDGPGSDPGHGRRPGLLVGVWGASGAPGRTTTAIALAAEAARRGHATLLLDADPYGGAVAQHLAVLDEVSGILGAARLANAGHLDVARLAALARQLDTDLRVLTGLPRPGRWPEVRPAAFETVLAVARRLDDLVVADTGAGLEAGSDDPFDASPSRDATTRAVLTEADAVVAVVSPDPVGLQRAARGLVELAEVRPTGAEVVAVNRMRSTLGWDRRDVVGLLERVAPRARIAFLPDDPRAADRALVSGRTLVESGDSELRRAFAGLATEALTVLGVASEDTGGRRGRRRLRRTG